MLHSAQLNLSETEGECAVEDPKIESVMYAKPLKKCKVNIGTKDNPKFPNLDINGMKKLLRTLLIYYTNDETFFQLHFQR
jgi:hypothetical protein